MRKKQAEPHHLIRGCHHTQSSTTCSSRQHPSILLRSSQPWRPRALGSERRGILVASCLSFALGIILLHILRTDWYGYRAQHAICISISNSGFGTRHLGR
ncbi:hypothetical protein CEP53_007643 [Fusarium sp. AF-6]|nr:hypothetical protein CEP53_007643 [Fusarium sp. AF-6]